MVVVNLPFRLYASTYSEFESLVGVYKSVPCHIALAFARDYDSRGNPTPGEFHPYFNITDITPDDILKFKQTKEHAKFFLSIGGRSEKYPFNLPTGEWVPRAVDSLKEIIRSYHFDGVDVYYQHIDASLDPNQFVEAWQKTIKRLQDDIPSLEVSLMCHLLGTTCTTGPCTWHAPTALTM
ncbi:chitinase 2-like [Neltuma alba]|uniref:chitinase 2-like n=1 Tax=Neltuma alba TaxID=207710 RepID=UPI0010A4F878|nr:chitinase 2-like [Prosopis alba]